ncbi:hypothetical protein TNCV_955531 [Trichonephila clavipes]|nr:hypothetical protein TNCV_955531 [Trichonephila clavipes]
MLVSPARSLNLSPIQRVWDSIRQQFQNHPQASTDHPSIGNNKHGNPYNKVTFDLQFRQTGPAKKKGGVQIEHPPFSPDLNPPYLPIPTTQTCFERKEI